MSKIWRCVVIIVLNGMLGVSANMAVTDSTPYVTHLVVPDVVPVAPKELLNVTYPSGVTANLGNELTPTQVKNVPAVTWNATAGQFYTLIFIDPDVPLGQNETNCEWQHWVVGNIPDSNVPAGDTIVQYVGAGPGQGSGLHRYVFLLYRQPWNLNFDEPRLNNTSASSRACCSSVKFANKYNLTDLVAGNFFQAQYDSYVPILYEQLGISMNSTGAANGSIITDFKGSDWLENNPNMNTTTTSVVPNISCNLRSGLAILFVLGLFYVR